MRYASAAIAALLVVLFAHVAAADTAFTMSERQVLGRLGVSYFVTSNYLDDDGDKQVLNDAHYREIGGHLAVRSAVLDRIELGLAIHVLNQFLTDNFDEYNETALGDMELDTVVRIVGNHRAALSVSAMAKIPMFYDETEPLPPGDGQVDLEGRVLASVKISLFTIGGDFGYRYRDAAPADLYVYGGEIGFAYSIVYGAFRLDGYSSARNEDDNAEARYWQQGPDYDAGFTKALFGIKAGNHWSFDLTGIYTVYGRNIAEGMRYMLATNVAF
jgi:hypothetical protein